MSRTEEVMAAIRTKLENRSLVSGDRLPSIRHFAETIGVAPSTVVEAYDRLAAEGLIRARRGSGFYVTGAGSPTLNLASPGPSRDSAVDPFWVSRQSLDAASTVMKPGCGWLPSSYMPEDALRRAVRTLAKSNESVLINYGNTRGAPKLRTLLIRKFAEEGVDIDPRQLLLTSSGTQAIDLICRLHLRPGDTALVDDPCYFNFQALLRAHQVKVVGVPYTPSGPDAALFETIVKTQKPRLYITNSALHNPTGATLSPQTAFRILSAAAAHDLTIVEDDIFADFEPEPSARLAVLDGLNRVIRIGSFSKTLSASIRCGYISGRADWIEALIDLQVATNFGGPSPVAAELISEVLSGGGYRKHMDQLRQRLVRARKSAAHRLEQLGLKPWLMPRGGFYLWCSLPHGEDSTAIAKAALLEDIVLAPGNVFSVSQSASCFLRFNVTQLSDARVLGFLRRALESPQREHG